MNKKQILYSVTFLVLLITEVLIALYVTNEFIRFYLGDILVVVVIYTFIRIFMPDRCRLLPLYIFIFAALVEGAQYIRIVELMGLSDNKFMSVLIGSVFDVKDVICYGVGCVLLGVYQFVIFSIKNQRKIK